ncbi:uncharacterized protein LOC123938611 [Meles meles]|uniref:uncharacterized protein LOC123938611 n=1 Tax=Meles meles TaxID=9662 RepID=UPI001E69F9FA|nr:uncharacterized protein LOC123938611 [Meles meles]
MGLSQSAESTYFMQTLQTLLRERGSKISKKELEGLFKVIHDFCPWFPKEGNIDLKHWRRVGQEIKKKIFARGADAVPPRTMATWSVIRDLLDPSHSIVLVSPKPGSPAGSLAPTQADEYLSEEPDYIEPTPPLYRGSPMSISSDSSRSGSHLGHPTDDFPPPPPNVLSGGDEFGDDDVYLDDDNNNDVFNLSSSPQPLRSFLDKGEDDLGNIPLEGLTLSPPKRTPPTSDPEHNAQWKKQRFKLPPPSRPPLPAPRKGSWHYRVRPPHAKGTYHALEYSRSCAHDPSHHSEIRNASPGTSPLCNYLCLEEIRQFVD